MRRHFQFTLTYLCFSILSSVCEAAELDLRFPYSQRNVHELEFKSFSEARTVTVSSPLERVNRPLIVSRQGGERETLWRCKAIDPNGRGHILYFAFLASPKRSSLPDNDKPAQTISYGSSPPLAPGSRLTVIGRPSSQGALRLLSSEPGAFSEGYCKFSLVDQAESEGFGVMAAFAAQEDVDPRAGSPLKRVVEAISEANLPSLANLTRLLATANFRNSIPRDAVDAAILRGQMAKTKEARLHFLMIAMMLGDSAQEAELRLLACKVDTWSTSFESELLYFARPPIGSPADSSSLDRHSSPYVLSLLQAADSSLSPEGRAFALSGLDSGLPSDNEAAPILVSLLQRCLQEGDRRSLSLLAALLEARHPELAPQGSSLEERAQGWVRVLNRQKPPE